MACRLPVWAEVVHWPAVSLRFRRRIRIAPGVHLNLGLQVGLNRRGMYTSAGIPGTGLYAIHHLRGPSDEHPSVAGNASGFLVGIRIAVALFAVLVVVAMSQQ